jgi:glycerophosphoryl diester phosphodiesterase
MIPFREFVEQNSFIACAHRGASGIAPENTISAVNMALESGAPMVEIDVQYTKDHQMVVFHDDTIERTTDGSGAICEMSLEEVQRLDAGMWFSPSFAGERIPKLVDVLELMRGRAYVNLEIKPRPDSEEARKETLELIELLRSMSMLDMCLFSSFDHRAIKFIRSMQPDLPMLALNIPGDARSPARVVRDCGADAFGCSVKELNPEMMRVCRQFGIPVGVYTVNTPDELNHVVSMGVIGCVTNMPHVIVPHYQSL